MDIELLLAKTSGVLHAYARMTPAEKKNPPTASFAKDYNRLCDMAVVAAPEIAEYMPPKIEIIERRKRDRSDCLSR